MIELEIPIYDRWWASLTTPEKERIASKVETKRLGVPTTVAYPVTTQIWNELPAERRQSIYRHCTDAHGILLPEWREGNALSY